MGRVSSGYSINRSTLALQMLTLVVWLCGCSAQPSSEHSKTTAETEQERAIAEIERMCGKVTVDEKSPGKPVIEVDLVQLQWIDAGVANIKGLTQVRVLNLMCSAFTDAGLANVEGLTQLQTLTLAATNITDMGLGHLKAMTQLQTLDLTMTKVTDAGLVHLKNFAQLKSLSLDDTQVTDAGMANLGGLTQLKELSLSGTKVTDAGIAKLHRALPNCQISH